MKRTKTPRGFRLYEFTDHYGEKCSLQASSLADTSAIWLGVNDPIPKVMSSQHPELPGDGTGWVNVPMPADVNLHGRMHLTRKQVKALLPKLIAFVEQGELP